METSGFKTTRKVITNPRDSQEAILLVSKVLRGQEKVLK